MELRVERNEINAKDTKLYPLGPIFSDNLRDAVIVGNSINGDSGESPAIYLNSGTVGCKVTDNRIGTSAVAGIVCAGSGNLIGDNDFTGDYEGWREPYFHPDGTPSGPSWILLTPGSRGNTITGSRAGSRKSERDVCDLVLDLPGYGGSSALVGDTSKVRIAPNGQHILREEDTELVEYDRIGNTGFLEAGNPTSAQSFDSAPGEVLAFLRYEEDPKDIDPELAGVPATSWTRLRPATNPPFLLSRPRPRKLSRPG